MQQTNNDAFFVENEESLNIKQEIQKYLGYWPWFAVSLVVCVISSYFYLKYASRIYQSTAKVKILDENDGLELPTSAFVFKRSNINLENEIEILTSYRILEKVVRQLDLTSTFYEEGRIQTSERYKLPFDYNFTVPIDSIKKSSYELYIKKDIIEIVDSKDGSNIKFSNHDTSIEEHNLPFQIKFHDSKKLNNTIGKKYIIYTTPIKNAVLKLKRSIVVNPIGEQSDLLSISLKGESVHKSEEVLNTLIDVFNEDGITDRQLVSKRTLDFIDERFLLLAHELDSIEINKKDFKQSNNLVYLPTDTQLSLEQRTKSDEEVFRIENQLELSSLLEEAVNDSSESGLLPANIGLENGNVNNLIQDFNAAVLEKEKLVGSAGENNPSVRLLMSKINDLKVNINKSLEAYKKQLRLSLNQIKRRSGIFKSQVSQIPEKEKLMRAINRQQNIKESLYLLLLQKREEAAINLAVTEPSVKVVEYALSSSKPISPKSNIVYLGALMLGLLVPFGVLYIVFMLDTKLHGKSDIEKMVSEIPVAAEIPKIKTGDNIFRNPNDRSVLAESFRILSSNVNYILPARDNAKVIFCTSTIKGEGKTFVSLNLSLALSSLNKRVLLIGADLRNPQIHSYFDIEKNKAGLSNYLHDVDFNWQSALIKGFEQHPNHDILISGSLPPNPAHLLTNGRFETLLEEAKDIYDYIIVDTAPTILVTDTLLISKFADATMYVTRADFTEKNLINHSIDLHKKNKLKNMAYVVNSVGANKSYGYNYGYGYGYGE
ncbi:GumC family protein [Pontimicrobium sp. IMCC45349]|uniref:GumC family protein n=1 Tax=Pontimicrobium sp. IMCC45349 TaxID=3391574 RepID=UPI0039A2C4CB